MKTLTTETQAGLFAAAVAVAEVLKRTAPEDARALAGAAYIIAAVAPGHAELTEWQLSAGLPTIAKVDYEEAVRAASLHALTAFGTGETQN